MIYLNKCKIVPTKFPDGTSQVWKLIDGIIKNENYIHWIFENESEIIILAQLKTLLNNTKVHLTIPYLPYARQDKEINNDNCFALHTFAKIINSLNFDSIKCTDPHSEVAGKLINNLSEEYIICKNFIEEHKIDLILFPDKGAAQKYSKFYTFIPYIIAEKIRDQSTGYINSFEIIGECNNKNVLIIDDICDGGGTFVLAANALYEKGATNVSLFVTHGIFSKGKDILYNVGIKNISCSFDFTKRELV